jgi:hypothetical protein
VEKYVTAVQATAYSIIWRMRLACSLTGATDTHSPYVMIFAVGYMKTLNVTLDLHCYQVTNPTVSKLLKYTYDTRSYATFYIFRDFSRECKLPFFKASNVSHNFSLNISGNNYPVTRVYNAHLVVSKKRWAESVARITVKKYANKLLPQYLQHKTLLGGSMCRRNDSTNMDLK